MAGSEYTATVGRLRMKGVSDGGVEKKKKKKKAKTAQPAGETSTALNTTAKEVQSMDTYSGESSRLEDGNVTGRVKTEAELRFEEVRRKRLHEKLAKEGVKTHKERVEEYNKYLSKLSEHNDMPKIGPG